MHVDRVGVLDAFPSIICGARLNVRSKSISDLAEWHQGRLVDPTRGACRSRQLQEPAVEPIVDSLASPPIILGDLVGCKQDPAADFLCSLWGGQARHGHGHGYYHTYGIHQVGHLYVAAASRLANHASAAAIHALQPQWRQLYWICHGIVIVAVKTVVSCLLGALLLWRLHWRHALPSRGYRRHPHGGSHPILGRRAR